MAKVSYDVSDVPDLPDQQHAPVGWYRAKVRSAEPKKSSAGNNMLEVIFDLTHDAEGKKVDKENFMPLWFYPIFGHDHPFVQKTLKDFLTAMGLKAKGQLDTNKLVGKEVQVKLKSDTDQDGDYRPRINKILPLNDPDGGVGEGPADEEPPEEADEEEPEGDEEESVDLDSLSRDELKALIKEQGLGTLKELGITKSTSDDDIRKLIAEKLGGDDEEEESEAEDEEEPEEEAEEEEQEEEEDEEEGVDLDTLDRSELKKLIKEEGLEVKVLKSDSDDDLRKKIAEAMGGDDEEEEEEESDEESEPEESSSDNYESMSVADLRKDLKERELETTGNKKTLIARLREDDGSEPF